MFATFTTGLGVGATGLFGQAVYAMKEEVLLGDILAIALVVAVVVLLALRLLGLSS